CPLPWWSYVNLRTRYIVDGRIFSPTSIIQGRRMVQLKRSMAGSNTSEGQRSGSETTQTTSSDGYSQLAGSDSCYTLNYEEPLYKARIRTEHCVQFRETPRSEWRR